ncbi:sugar ABC transporter permease [Paenibacillus psychroresistens]|uniref:Sugar ABC transporter permease n=1 Tax=Paenibacillus psychroresistens TaxID=1778678 RepID=A0A6B8RPM5_9BACL|nr:sugar ABC transporter permease [Paenibacillus psychroresistens]QGQ97764.1 sugar ABC transporter permease [Paenibacillus psychroresistens]
MAFKGGYTKFFAILMVVPALVLYSLFVLIPSIGNVLLSFTDFTGNPNLPMKWLGLYNYKRAFNIDMEKIGNSIKVTIIFALSVTIIQNILAVLLAVLVNIKLRFSTFYRSVIFLPNVLGVVVIGLIWTLVLDPYSGPVNSLLHRFNLDSALLGDPMLALGLVIFITIWANVGYAMLIYLAGLQSIPSDLYEASRIDGANTVQTFLRITLPLLRSSITINVLISLIGTLGSYDLIYVLTSGGPDGSTMTMGMFIIKNLLGGGGKQGYVSALSIIQFLIVFIVIMISQYFLRRKEEEL